LASINERVREIGIRKALGASGRNIFTQFVAEAVTLSVLGGALGVVAASGLIDFLQKVLPPGNAPLLSAGSFVIGFGFSVVMGMLAGLYPALQAAKLDPIEALRYE
jgi:putative ABC transport system permease protein